MEEKINYNDEPVYYCNKCLSLLVKTIGDLDYCAQCGSTDIDKAHIKYWETLYMEKYNKPFIEKK